MVADNSKTAEGPSKRSIGCNASSPRKRLMLSVSDREKLLNWDAQEASEEASNGLVSTRKEQVDFIKAASF